MSIRRGAALLAAATMFVPAAAVAAGASASGTSEASDLSTACTSAVDASEAYRTGALAGSVDERTERVAQFEADLVAAEDLLEAAEAALAAADADLLAAEEAVVVAEDELAQAEETGTPEDVTAAQEVLAQAQDALETAQTAADEADAARTDAFDTVDSLQGIVLAEERAGLELLLELVEGPPLDPAATTAAELSDVVSVVDYVVDEEYAALLGDVVDACFDDEAATDGEPLSGPAAPSTAPAAQPVRARADFTG